MTKGTYTLLVELRDDAPIEVGALGTIDCSAGWYAYTGSAFGPGGFGRVDRHRAVASGDNDARHWHVDYLLGHAASAIETVTTTADRDVECAVSRALDGDRIAGFGASDCDCRSHLVYNERRDRLVASIARAHDDHE